MTGTVILKLSAVVCALGSLWLVGCTTTPGRGTTLFPQGHELTKTAKSMRDANPPTIEIPRELQKHPLPPYTVEPGDVLLVLPAELDSPVRLPGDQPVLPDGTINLGKYGHLQVMGRTVPEIETLVLAAVKKEHPQGPLGITVRLVARQSKVYYVIGEVNSPGAFQLNGRETVLDAIMQAGGLNDRASRDQIILSRPTKPDCPRIVLPVCWTRIVQLGDTSTNYQIAPGDRIFVPTRGFIESIPGLGHHVKTPCKCDPHSPLPFPPYHGQGCEVPGNGFRGSFIEVAPTQPSEPIPPPKKVVPVSSAR